MSLQTKVAHALLKNPVGRHVEKILRQVKVVLTLLIVVLATSFLCLLTVTAYVIVQLAQGR
jgi:hypothetical protein